MRIVYTLFWKKTHMKGGRWSRGAVYAGMVGLPKKTTSTGGKQQKGKARTRAYRPCQSLRVEPLVRTPNAGTSRATPGSPSAASAGRGLCYSTRELATTRKGRPSTRR